jgi:hypothetical protein
MPGWLFTQGSDGAIAALLIAGHVVGDFVFQTRGMVERKGEFSRLALPASSVVAAQALFLVPFLSPWGLVVLLGLGGLHAGIDRFKFLLQGRWAGTLTLFVSDQIAHLCALLGAWLLLRGPHAGWFVPLNEDLTRRLTSATVMVAAYAWNGNGAAALIAGLLRGFPLSPVPAAAEAGAIGRRIACGRMIGILERMPALTLVLIGQWGGLGLIMAAKSIARFRDLDQREFSEYYLIGTLASLLVAVATGLLVKFLIG